MPKDDRINLMQALAVTAELTGTTLSDAAARVMVSDLEAYSLQQVLVALVRCRRELKTRLTVAAIIERLDDGRPGPEEAWAMIPKDEHGSVVWTEEMASAYGVAYGLLAEGDTIAARMAFRETYAAMVTKARSEQIPVKWTPSLGFDKGTREAAITEAVRKNRLTHEHALILLPPPDNADPTPLLESSARLAPADVHAKLTAYLSKSTRH